MLRLAYGTFFLAVGVAHLVIPSSFVRQVPPWVPLARAVVAVSGVVEIIIGGALIVDVAPRLMALTAVALLVSFVPVHLHAVTEARNSRDRWFAWMRFPVNAVYAAIGLVVATHS